MAHTGHWYLSAFVWFAVAWYVASSATDTVINHYLSRPGRPWMVGLTAMAALALFTVTFACARSIDHQFGVFDDLTLIEFCWLMSVSLFAGASASLYVFVRSKEKQQ